MSIVIDKKESISIAVANKSHITDVARIQKDYISGLLSSLSLDIIELFYENLLCFNEYLLAVLVKDSTVIGFISASFGKGVSHKKVFLYRPFLLLYNLIKHPDSCFKLSNYFCRRASVPECMPVDKLLYIAVKKEYQGNRYGEDLFNYLVEVSTEKKIGQIGLHVEKINSGALDFYLKMGGEIIDCFHSLDREIAIVKFNMPGERNEP